MKQRSLRVIIRSVALTAIAPTIGFLLVYLLEMVLDVELSKLLTAVINLVLVAPIAFVLFPKRLGIPFGRVETRTYLRGVGLYLPAGAWKHVLLGLFLAACSLAGMLVGSMLTGKYAVDWDTITVSQLVFSLNPGLWEELFFRGVLMILLIQVTGSLRRAFAIQVILFGLMHIKGLDLLAFVDVVSVMVLAVGFTYAAYKTRLLVAGIVWHYFHDAFLFTVRLPGGVYTGVAENAAFFGGLWVMVGVACVATKLAAERFGVRAADALYSPGEVQPVTRTSAVEAGQ